MSNAGILVVCGRRYVLVWRVYAPGFAYFCGHSTGGRGFWGWGAAFLVNGKRDFNNSSIVQSKRQWIDQEQFLLAAVNFSMLNVCFPVLRR